MFSCNDLFLLFQNDKNEAAMVPITILGIGVEYTSSSMVLFLFEKSSTKFQKVSAISCKNTIKVWFISLLFCVNYYLVVML